MGLTAYVGTSVRGPCRVDGDVAQTEDVGLSDVPFEREGERWVRTTGEFRSGALLESYGPGPVVTAPCSMRFPWLLLSLQLVSSLPPRPREGPKRLTERMYRRHYIVNYEFSLPSPDDASFVSRGVGGCEREGEKGRTN